MKKLLIGLISIVLLAQAPVSAEDGLKKKTMLYVGVGASQNGVVTTNVLHLNDTTKPIGYSIDDASAVPVTAYVEIFVGSGTMNNGVVSKNSNHGGGSTTSIGYLSSKPVLGGYKLYSGTGACNNGVATNNTLHAGCSTEFLGYALPRNWPD